MTELLERQKGEVFGPQCIHNYSDRLGTVKNSEVVKVDRFSTDKTWNEIKYNVTKIS